MRVAEVERSFWRKVAFKPFFLGQAKVGPLTYVSEGAWHSREDRAFSVLTPQSEKPTPPITCIALICPLLKASLPPSPAPSTPP